MMNSTSPLPASQVAADQQLQAAVQDAVNRAQAAYNSILVRQPSDFSDFGQAVQANVLANNRQNQQPGVVAPGFAIPTLTAATAGTVPAAAPTRPGPVNAGWWGGRAPSYAGRSYAGFRGLSGPSAQQWPDGSPVHSDKHGGPASRNVIANPNAYLRANQRYSVSAGRGPVVGGAHGETAGGPFGVPPEGFVGRGETYAGQAAAIDTTPVYGAPNPPAPPLTLDTRGLRGLGTAYPVSADTCPELGAVAAGGPDESSAGAGEAGSAADYSPLWWLLAAGAVVWLVAASDDSKPARKQYTRKAA